MPDLNKDDLGNFIYEINGIRGCVPAQTIGAHRMYNAAQCRVSEVWNQNGLFANRFLFQGTASPTGPIYYLPYDNNIISSFRLPGPVQGAPPPALKFMTANLSGCRVYIDSVANSTDLVVYHANTTAHGAPLGSVASFQSNGASAVLNTQHMDAIQHYGQQNPAVNLIPRTSLRKQVYYAGADASTLSAHAKNRKNYVLRTNNQGNDVPVLADAEFAGGTAVVGFFENGRWNFYYQTFGIVEFSRYQGKAHLARKLLSFQWTKVHKIRTQTTVTGGNTPWSVVDHDKFWP